MGIMALTVDLTFSILRNIWNAAMKESVVKLRIRRMEEGNLLDHTLRRICQATIAWDQK